MAKVSLDILVGKRVVVIQYDDEDTPVSGYCEGFVGSFVVLRREECSEPTLFIQLTNVKGIEVLTAEGTVLTGSTQFRLIFGDGDGGEEVH